MKGGPPRVFFCSKMGIFEDDNEHYYDNTHRNPLRQLVHLKKNYLPAAKKRWHLRDA